MPPKGTSADAGKGKELKRKASDVCDKESGKEEPESSQPKIKLPSKWWRKIIYSDSEEVEKGSIYFKEEAFAMAAEAKAKVERDTSVSEGEEKAKATESTHLIQEEALDRVAEAMAKVQTDMSVSEAEQPKATGPAKVEMDI